MQKRGIWKNTSFFHAIVWKSKEITLFIGKIVDYQPVFFGIAHGVGGATLFVRVVAQ